VYSRAGACQKKYLTCPGVTEVFETSPPDSMDYTPGKRKEIETKTCRRHRLQIARVSPRVKVNTTTPTLEGLPSSYHSITCGNRCKKTKAAYCLGIDWMATPPELSLWYGIPNPG